MADTDYEPGTLEEAWGDYRNANPKLNHPQGREIFRAGFRRGIAQGALLASSTFVHAAPADTEGGEQ